MKPYAVPWGYVRRSVASKRDPGDISRTFQEDKVRAMAGEDGPTLHIEASDWGRSGGRASALKRKGFLAMVTAVEAGEVSAIYAYSVDRLARDVEAGAHLLNECERVGITITTREGRFAPGDKAARTLFHALGMANESYSDQSMDKASATIATRRARHDVFGRAPYGMMYRKGKLPNEPSTLIPNPAERPDLVVEAFRKAGSYLGAVDILNQAGLPAPEGAAWSPTTVRRTIMRWAPELVPMRSRPRVRTRSRRLFAQLLVCPHADQHPMNENGVRMSAMMSSSRTPYDWRYECRAGLLNKAHPRPVTVTEKKIKTWAQAYLTAELGRRLAFEVEGRSPDDEAKIAALDARAKRIDDMYDLGKIKRDDYLRRIAEVDAQRPRIEASHRAVTRFALHDYIDWTADPAEVNAALRELWDHIELNAALEPVRAAWNIGQSPAEREAQELTPEQEREQMLSDAPEPSPATKRWWAREQAKRRPRE